MFQTFSDPKVIFTLKKFWCTRNRSHPPSKWFRKFRVPKIFRLLFPNWYHIKFIIFALDFSFALFIYLPLPHKYYLSIASFALFIIIYLFTLQALKYHFHFHFHLHCLSIDITHLHKPQIECFNFNT